MPGEVKDPNTWGECEMIIVNSNFNEFVAPRSTGGFIFKCQLLAITTLSHYESFVGITKHNLAGSSMDPGWHMARVRQTFGIFIFPRAF